MTNRDTYREFCKSQPDLPLFMQPFWLDMTTTPGNWDAVFSYEEDGSLRGAWAFRYGSNKYGMHWIRLPELSPCTALWIKPKEDLSIQKDISYRHEVILDLERQLPKAQIVELKLPWTFKDWLPFYWLGYRQETRYTFRFQAPDITAIENCVSKSFMRNLRAAERHYTIEEGTVADLHGLMERVFEMREVRTSLSQHKLEEIVATLKSKQQCKIYAARDTEGVQAVVLMAWDTTTTYYLIGGRRKTDSRNGINLLLWQAIKDAASRGHAFDFEGSMIQGVNRFFQNFGAELTPYHYIYRYKGLARVKYL